MSASESGRLLVDASIAITWTFPERAQVGADAARSLIGERPLATTTLALYEIANTVGRIHPGRAAAAIESCALVAAVCGEPQPLTREDLAAAARLAEEHALTFYGASYAAISARTGWPLVSADRDLLGPGLAITVDAALKEL